MSLLDALTDSTKREAVVDDCMDLINSEVSDKGGLSGMAIKGGYKAVNGIKPGFVRKVANDLLPEFAQAVDPIFTEAKNKDASVGAYFVDNKSRVADALLQITDEKASRSTNRVVKSTYDKLRKIAKSNVESAVPRLGKLIEKHAS